MRMVYIVGPYRSRWGWLGRLLNIWRARKVAWDWWRRGYAVICPHSNSAMMDGAVGDERFLEAGREMLRRSDVVVMMKGWEKSRGSKAEWHHANWMRKKIVYL